MLTVILGMEASIATIIEESVRRLAVFSIQFFLSPSPLTMLFKPGSH